MSNREGSGYPHSAVAGFLLFCLVLAYVFSFIDRQILALLVTPIKASLDLSDFEIGLVQGPAFSVFFCLAAIPVGWMIDRYERRMIVIAGVPGFTSRAPAIFLGTRLGNICSRADSVTWPNIRSSCA